MKFIVMRWCAWLRLLSLLVCLKFWKLQFQMKSKKSDLKLKFCLIWKNREFGNNPSIFSLPRDWSKRVTWQKMLQLQIFNFQTCAKNWLNSLEWRENMLRYLSLDISYPSLKAHSFPRATLFETVCFSKQVMSGDKYPSLLLFNKL